MANYEPREDAQMVVKYVGAGYVGARAVEAYRIAFGDARCPDARTIISAYRRFNDTGHALLNRKECGAPRNARTPAMEEQILHEFDADPTTSIRKVARRLRTSYGTVQRTLKAEKKHAFHYTRVQSLELQDYPTRLHFCRFVIACETAEPGSVNRIIFSDESSFGRDGTWNSHNFHVWSDKENNPRAMVEAHHQRRFPPLNLWAGIYGDKLVRNKMNLIYWFRKFLLTTHLIKYSKCSPFPLISECTFHPLVISILVFFWIFTDWSVQLRRNSHRGALLWISSPAFTEVVHSCWHDDRRIVSSRMGRLHIQAGALSIACVESSETA